MLLQKCHDSVDGLLRRVVREGAVLLSLDLDGCDASAASDADRSVQVLRAGTTTELGDDPIRASSGRQPVVAIRRTMIGVCDAAASAMCCALMPSARDMLSRHFDSGITTGVRAVPRPPRRRRRAPGGRVPILPSYTCQ